MYNYECVRLGERMSMSVWTKEGIFSVSLRVAMCAPVVVSPLRYELWPGGVAGKGGMGSGVTLGWTRGREAAETRDPMFSYTPTCPQLSCQAQTLTPAPAGDAPSSHGQKCMNFLGRKPGTSERHRVGLKVEEGNREHCP